MAGSLKDQLMQAGLVSADRARKLEKEARAEKHAKRQGAPKGQPKGKGKRKGEAKPPEPSALTEAQQRARELNREKAERDRAQMRAIADKAKEKALRAEIKQIIEANDQRTKTQSDDDVAFNFVHGKKVKRIYVPAQQREQISRGSLVIVNNDGQYSLLPKKAAEKVRARDPKRILVDNDEKPPEPGSDDEYYAQFQVPDDLDW
ncbi:MAG: DUF2058 family protein [Gammaproteobacteria bacterium]|jgi:uncharacterized protein YaiL (DUF2058 family)|nr:DUF2058 family protein [Gammaproteobacteria bacterium]